MKAVFVEGIDSIAVKDIPAPKAGINQVLVKMELANICSQTDLHMLQGLYDPGLSYPYILGHEGAGVIVDVGEGLRGQFTAGDRVAYKGMHGCMAEYTAIPGDSLIKIPDSVSFETASMYEVAACAYALIRQTVQMGDKVLIIGQGCAGLLGTIFAKHAGAGLIVTSDISEWKRQQSKAQGAQVVIDPGKDDLKQVCRELTGGLGFDAALDFAGTPQTMNTCVDMIRAQGRIGMFGVNCQPFTFDFFSLHDKGGSVITAGHEYFYSIVPFKKMLDFTLAGMLSLDAFITHKFPLEDVEKGFELIRNRDEKVLRIGLTPM